jgi:hypothetical protein
MTEQDLKDLLRKELLDMFEETFEKVHGSYLDRGTSLFETLNGITAEEASRPVSANCASIAAQVEHTRFYIETLMQYIVGEQPKVDWGEIWRTVEKVTPEEWTASQQRLQDSYQGFRKVLTSTITWKDEDEVGGVLAILVHTAYHLGEIRQALCTLKTPS